MGVARKDCIPLKFPKSSNQTFVFKCIAPSTASIDPMSLANSSLQHAIREFRKARVIKARQGVHLAAIAIHKKFSDDAFIRKIRKSHAAKVKEIAQKIVDAAIELMKINMDIEHDASANLYDKAREDEATFLYTTVYQIHVEGEDLVIEADKAAQ